MTGEIPKRVVTQRLVDMREHREVGGRCQDHNRAIGRAAFHRAQRETATGAGTVVDDK